jgi:rod shape-determining protein MreC
MARAARGRSRVDVAIALTCGLLAVFATVLPDPTRVSIAASLQRTAAKPLLAIQRSAERARAALIERERIAARADSLALRVNQLAALEDENARLRALLLLGQRLGADFVPAEALHGQNMGDGDAMLITAGSRAGVRVRSAVVAPEGVVGLITAVTPNTSQAILWTHPDFAASAMAVDGSAFGIVEPFPGDEPERLLLQLRGVPFRDTLPRGTLITTSGLGGVFPRGIPIGTVIAEAQTSEQWSRTYLVRPAVRPHGVSSVIVLAPQWVSGNTAAVWSTAAAADSAVRRIVAAGDSIARRDAEERAAKQRALDSATALLSQPTLTPIAPRADSLGRPPGGSAAPTLPAPKIAVPPRRDSPRRPPPARRDTIRPPNGPSAEDGP